MHEIQVSPGDGILVPGGMPHAIGDGILLVEAQEPTDQSILLERVGEVDETELFLGLGRDIALSAVTMTELHDAAALRVRAAARPSELTSALPAAADPFFRMELLDVGSETSPQVEPGFAIAVVLAGAGHILDASGASHALQGGEVWVIPSAAGSWTAEGDLSLLVCRAGTTWPQEAPTR